MAEGAGTRAAHCGIDIMEVPMRSALSALLLLHGLVHAVGFIGPLELVSSAPYQTRWFGRPIVNSSPAARSLAMLWLLLVLAYSLAAVAVFVQAGWWIPFTLVTTFASLLLCLTAWPASKVGLAVDGLILLMCLWALHAKLGLALLALIRALPF
jgi:hypothetical protein